MNDLISRQAAIDGIMDFMPAELKADATVEERVNYSAWCCALSCAEAFVRTMPPAEPRWIPCSERLPEDGKWCLFTDGENMSVERYKLDAIDHFFPNGRWFEFDDAVAWMPLPEPYEERREADG